MILNFNKLFVKNINCEIRRIKGISIINGFGRYHYKEAKNFSYYSRASLYETKTWLTKAFNRQLITKDNFNSFQSDINIIVIKLNNYINSIGKKNINNKINDSEAK